MMEKLTSKDIDSSRVAAENSRELKFTTTILLAKRTATGICVPPEIVNALGAGKKPPVRITIGDYTYRSTIAVMGGEFMIPLSAENRNGAGVEAGYKVDVKLELDNEPRTIEIPDDLLQALKSKTDVWKSFENLALSKRKEFVRQVEEAKTQETREKRIAGIVAIL